ncbi:MAG: PDZ domain-containing protein [Silvanigrellaceae bacterium]
MKLMSQRACERIGRESLSRALMVLGCTLAMLCNNSVFATGKASKSLQLVGAIVSARGGVALVKNRDTSEVKAFKTGEDLYNLGTLLSVDRTQMLVLENDGQMTLISNKLGGMAAIKPARVVKVLESTADRYVEDGFQRVGTKIDVDSRYRDRLLKDELPNILMQASSEPVVDGKGVITGFRIFQFDQNSIFHKLGLQEGDEVQELNGSELTNVAKAIQTLNGLREANEVTVKVRRNGADVTLQLNVR